MTTNRILRLLMVATTCLLFSSCFDSKVPLSDPGKSKADERLAGVWRQRGESGEVTYYHFGRADDRLPASVMRVIGIKYTPDGKMEQLDDLLVFPSTIGDKTYLNVTSGQKPQFRLVEERGWSPETVNTYSIFRYQFTGDVLTVQWFDSEAKKRAVEAGKIKGKVEKDQDGNARVHFTDTTENLAKFVTEAGDDLYSKDVVRLERVK